MERKDRLGGIDSTARFSRGDKVCLKSDSTQCGVITEGPRARTNGYDYEVWLANTASWISDHLLAPAPPKSQLRRATRDELLRDLLLAKLRHPLTEALYAYRASRTFFEAYQFRPALKFLNSPHQGLLIADEVGLGKTIEAAIIYLELKARMDISRVLVLCPSRLTSKWQDEFRNRFEEDFEILDSSRIARIGNDLKQYGPGAPLKAIGSFELLRRNYAEFSRNHFELDLLIMDEAHHARNQNTATYEMALTMVNAAAYALLLSATPLQMHSNDLFSLLKLIAPSDFEDQAIFGEQLEPNAFINHALKFVAIGDSRNAIRELRNVEQTKVADRFLNSPYYEKVLIRLQSLGPDTSRPDRVDLQRSIMQLHTLDTVMTRTRKREVANAPVRAAFTILVVLTDGERRFYESVLEDVRLELESRNRDARGFATIMKERQAASCLPALQAALHEARSGVDFELDPDVSEFDAHVDDEQTASAHIRSSKGRLDRYVLPHEDTKYRELVAILTQVLHEDPSSKVLVFSFFKRTLRYLHERLRHDGFVAGVIHGDVPMKERHRVIQRFRTDSNQRVLFSSEVGAEGLDFEFCDVLVNYDLPWNPMQVEQRIGRLDRFGQTHERIRIFNFYLADSIETRIFQRLYDRIGIFERSIGDLEAILGEEISRISRKVIQASLTPEEQMQLADQAADRIIQNQRAEEELEKSRDALLGTSRILDQHVENTISSGKTISPDEVAALLRTFMAAKFPQIRFEEDPEEKCWTVKLDSALVKYISETVEVSKSHYQMSETFKSAMHEKRRIALTFDSDLARERSLLEFITIRHPLAQSAVRFWKEQSIVGVPATQLVIQNVTDEPSKGRFFLYIVDLQAVRPQVTLVSMLVSDDGSVGRDDRGLIVQALTTEGGAASIGVEGVSTVEILQRHADDAIARVRHEVEGDALTDNEALLATRTASVTASYKARIERTEELARSASEERIRRMRTSEAENLRVKRDAKLLELNKSKRVAVTSTLIACGRYESRVDLCSANHVA